MSESHEPASGFLASNLLPLAQAYEKLKPVPASCGLSTVDEAALDGGFRYGEITSIAGTSGMGKNLVGCSPIAEVQSMTPTKTKHGDR